MPKKGFQQLNRRRIENGKEPFANPRNAAAGTIRRLDPKTVADMPLDILFYEVLHIENNKPASHWDVLKLFPKWGLKTDAHNKRSSSSEEIKTYHKKVSEKRDDFEYDIDGIVIKLDSYKQRESLGVRQRSPRWAFAWKFPPKEEVTKLEDIVVQVGRTGMLKVTGGIIHYASREALNIKGLGEKTTAAIVEKGLVTDISDLYRLTEDDLLALEGFAQKSARQLHQAIQRAKNPKLDRFLYALGIRHVGKRAARILSQKFGSLANLKKADRKRLEKIPEIGPEIAESVRGFFRQDENWQVLKNLSEAGVKVQKMHTERESRVLEEKTFVFTGKLEEYTRQEAETLVEDLGGHATSSVSGETDYVVVGEDPGSKYEEARKQKTKIIDEKEFKKLLTS